MYGDFTGVDFADSAAVAALLLPNSPNQHQGCGPGAFLA